MFYKRCLSFWKDVSRFFWKFVLKVFVKCGLKIGKCFVLQVDKYLRAIYPKVLKDFCYVLTLLTILFHHWIWWTILRLGSLFGTGAGHRMDHECNGAKCLWQFCLKGLWSFWLGNFRKRHRGTMIIWICFAKDTRRASMAHFGRQHVGLP
mgnify:CR=1 FL=1